MLVPWDVLEATAMTNVSDIMKQAGRLVSRKGQHAVAGSKPLMCSHTSVSL